jgi:hypothetical protein
LECRPLAHDRKKQNRCYALSGPKGVVASMKSVPQAKPLVLRIHDRLCIAAFLGSVGLAIYYREWEVVGLVGGGALVVLTFGYMILARLFGWPRLRWRRVLADLADFIIFW